jgi:hypothetical protein
MAPCSGNRRRGGYRGVDSPLPRGGGTFDARHGDRTLARMEDWAHPILAEPFRLEDSHLLIPDRPGNGIEWDEDAIERYRLEV